MGDTSFHVTSTPPTSKSTPVTVSPQNNDLLQRLQAANSQYLSFPNIQAPLMVSSRERSPFQQASALSMETPAISPRESHQEQQYWELQHQKLQYRGQQHQEQRQQYQHIGYYEKEDNVNISRESSSAYSTPSQPSNPSAAVKHLPATSEPRSSKNTPRISESKKPSQASADTGMYTCTYSRCPLRFETTEELKQHTTRHLRKKHKTLTASIDNGESGVEPQARSGKCERINPSTGKPCDVIFARRYDLTRHEDTIHNIKKQKLSCPWCTERKLFSRNDALTRHLRVIHPEQKIVSGRRSKHGLEAKSRS